MVRRKLGRPAGHSNYDLEAAMCSPVAKPIPNYSLQQTARGAKWEKIGGLAVGKVGSNDPSIAMATLWS